MYKFKVKRIVDGFEFQKNFFDGIFQIDEGKYYLNGLHGGPDGAMALNTPNGQVNTTPEEIESYLEKFIPRYSTVYLSPCYPARCKEALQKISKFFVIILYSDLDTPTTNVQLYSSSENKPPIEWERWFYKMTDEQGKEIEEKRKSCTCFTEELVDSIGGIVEL